MLLSGAAVSSSDNSSILSSLMLSLDIVGKVTEGLENMSQKPTHPWLEFSSHRLALSSVLASRLTQSGGHAMYKASRGGCPAVLMSRSMANIWMLNFGLC